MQLILDHVCYGGCDLQEMRRRLSLLGLPSEYGGSHGSVTHMAFVGFPDGSYLELIAPKEPDQQMPPGQRWAQLMLDDAGPCAWAARVPTVNTELERLQKIGKAVAGPLPGTRTKPDGTQLFWETGCILPGDPGSLLPFLIADISSRRSRAELQSYQRNLPISGVGKVLIAVDNFESSVREFRDVFDFCAPDIEESDILKAEVASFPESPVILLKPLRSAGRLAERIARYGQRPAAFLFWTSNLESATKHFELSAHMRLADSEVAWFNPEVLQGMRLGLVQV